MDLVFVRPIYRTARLCFWITLIALFALWAVSTLSWPLARDQGDFAWIGSVLRNGGVLYRDAWDVKGPFATIPFALTQIVFGHNMWGIRVFDLLVTLVNLGALAVIARRFWDTKAAEYAVIMGSVFATWLNFAISEQPDEWCGCLITLVVALLSTRRQITLWAVAGGSFVIGICVLEKPIYAAFVLLFVPFVNRNRRVMFQWVIAAAAGFLLPILAALTYFAIHHAIGGLINTYLLFNLRAHLYVEGSAMDQLRACLYSWQAFLPLSAGVPLAIFGAVVLGARNSRWGALYLLWFVVNVFLVVVQRKYFEYHWVSLITPVALGAGVALRQLREFRPAAAIAVLLTFILLFINEPLRSVKEWALYQTGKVSRSEYDSHFVYLNKNHYDFQTIGRLAAYVEEHTAPTDTMQVWGFDAGINYLANRAAPGRFGYTYPLQIGDKNPYQAGYRAEFLAKIYARPPRYVLVPNNDAFGLTPIPSDQSFNDFHDFSDFVRAHYDQETTIENWTLYRLR